MNVRYDRMPLFMEPKARASAIEACQRAYKACLLHSVYGWYVVIPQCGCPRCVKAREP